MLRIFDFLRTSDIPAHSRPSYRIELMHFLFWGTVVGAVEGNIAGIVAAKTFHGSQWLTSVVWATPIFVNTLNVFWGLLIRGRRRVPMFLLLATCGLASIGSVGLTSSDWAWGGWCFAAQLGLTHIFLSGLLTLRSTIWKCNYPASHRARITGRLQTLRLIVVLTAGALIATIFDNAPDFYRYVYPAVALVGLLSLLPMRKLQVQGEADEIQRYRAARRLAHKQTDGATRGVWGGLRETAAILRTDAPYRRYQLGQFFLGSANFFTDPVLLIVLTTQLGLGYFHSSLLLVLIPMVVMLLTIRVWARYFDRVGVIRFRVLNSALRLGSYTCVAISMWLVGTTGHDALWIAMPILVVGRIINGVCKGGGQIAWNIGHLHFAREHQVELYMGIHVALTGVRGLFMPLLGSLANHAMGNVSFSIAIVISIIAHLIFRRGAALDRADQTRQAQGEPGDSAPTRTEIT